jgi:peptidoglycan/LPS O-acetylase OafA/YrhL
MRNQRIPALDGLRAIACVMVVASHTKIPGSAGGWLGVDVFFVLSGYLITGQLLDGACENLRLFWWRRLARLWPALLILLLCTTVISYLNGLALWPNMAAAIYMLSPIYARFNPGNLYPEHAWSLAVEMQLYITWALIIRNIQHWPRRRIQGMCLGLALTSLAAKGALLSIGHPVQAYLFGPSHAEGLLVGAALGAGMRVPAPSRLFYSSAIALGIAMPLATASGRYAQLGWIPIALAMAVATIGLATTAPGYAATRLLDAAPIRWLGVRSYSLYLWHIPLLLTVRDHLAATGYAGIAAAVMASIGAASLSYRFVEVPARKWLNARAGVVTRMAHAA